MPDQASGIEAISPATQAGDASAPVAVPTPTTQEEEDRANLAGIYEALDKKPEGEEPEAAAEPERPAEEPAAEAKEPEAATPEADKRKKALDKIRADAKKAREERAARAREASERQSLASERDTLRAEVEKSKKLQEILTSDPI